MTNEALTFVISIAGGIISLSFIIIGFFLSRLVGDLRNCIEETGKNKGKIELVEQQQRNDTRRIEEMTQLELKQMSSSVSHLSKDVSDLSKSVNILVLSLAKKGIEENGN